MRKLSKYEKETIINWNEGENIASIYTFNASLKRRLEDFSISIPWCGTGQNESASVCGTFWGLTQTITPMKR